MITLDKYLLNLHAIGISQLSSKIPTRDKKILISLAKQLDFGNFLTENQGKLLIKIFTENKIHLTVAGSTIDELLVSPMWSHPFRVVEHVRNIFIDKENSKYITLEFTYNKTLKVKLANIKDKIEGQVLVNSKKTLIPLTEKNIYTVISEFKNQNFKISEDLLNFYSIISDVLKDKKEYFNIFTTENKKLVESVKSEIGEISKHNQLLVEDRKIRYQYTTNTEISGVSLEEKIAGRKNSRIFIDMETYDMSTVFESLKKLDRFPLLLIFNGHDAVECRENIDRLSGIFEDTLLKNKIGVYFRFDNTSEENKKFNEKISSLKLNSNLDEETLVAGISNGKLPKFMLKNAWYPKTVLSFSNNFKNNKTVFYADAVDLVIFYNKKEPLGGNVDAIV